MMSSISTTKSWDKSLSACGETRQRHHLAAPSSASELRLGVLFPTSSITMIWTLSTFATPFLIRSRIRPGVAMTTCTEGRNREHECTQWKEEGDSSAHRSYQSHPDAWCRLAGWCPRWWPWPWLLPGVWLSGWRSGWLAGPAHVWEPKPSLEYKNTQTWRVEMMQPRQLPEPRMETKPNKST